MTRLSPLSSAGLACGIDVVDVESFARALRVSGSRMTRVCFTEQERHDAGDCADRLAARWAVKEAVAKALGVGLLQGVGLREIETVVDEAGAPRLVLHGGARHLAQTRRLGMWAISVSHERGVAVAMAVAGRGDGPLLDDEEVSDG